MTSCLASVSRLTSILLLILVFASQTTVSQQNKQNQSVGTSNLPLASSYEDDRIRGFPETAEDDLYHYHNLSQDQNLNNQLHSYIYKSDISHNDTNGSDIIEDKQQVNSSSVMEDNNLVSNGTKEKVQGQIDLSRSSDQPVLDMSPAEGQIASDPTTGYSQLTNPLREARDGERSDMDYNTASQSESDVKESFSNYQQSRMENNTKMADNKSAVLGYDGEPSSDFFNNEIFSNATEEGAKLKDDGMEVLQHTEDEPPSDSKISTAFPPEFNNLMDDNLDGRYSSTTYLSTTKGQNEAVTSEPTSSPDQDVPGNVWKNTTGNPWEATDIWLQNATDTVTDNPVTQSPSTTEDQFIVSSTRPQNATGGQLMDVSSTWPQNTTSGQLMYEWEGSSTTSTPFVTSEVFSENTTKFQDNRTETWTIPPEFGDVVTNRTILDHFSEAEDNATLATFSDGFGKSISIIILSELGDKTFFIAAILAMNSNKVIVFLGAVAALFLMTILSGLLGWVATTYISREATYYVCTTVLFLFSFKMIWEAIRMTHDDLEETRKEVENELGLQEINPASQQQQHLHQQDAGADRNLPDDNTENGFHRGFTNKAFSYTENQEITLSVLNMRHRQDSGPQPEVSNAKPRGLTQRFRERCEAIFIAPIRIIIRDINHLLKPATDRFTRALDNFNDRVDKIEHSVDNFFERIKSALSRILVSIGIKKTSHVRQEENQQVPSEDNWCDTVKNFFAVDLLHRCLNEESSKGKRLIKIIHLFLKSFSLSFLAEWGDRSQMATIVLAGVTDVGGVIIGGCVGHFICTGLAVICGAVIGRLVSVRKVTLLGGIIFFAFAISSICTYSSEDDIEMLHHMNRTDPAV